MFLKSSAPFFSGQHHSQATEEFGSDFYEVSCSFHHFQKNAVTFLPTDTEALCFELLLLLSFF